MAKPPSILAFLGGRGDSTGSVVVGAASCRAGRPVQCRLSMVKRLKGGKLVLRTGKSRRTEANSAGHLRKAVASIARVRGSTAIEFLPVSSLRANPRNARKHGDRQIAQLAASITQFGFLLPILVDEDRIVLAGHGRLLAAKQLGLADVPVIQVAHLSEAEKRAYAIADNRIAELSEWDLELLKGELEALSVPDLDFEVEITGFDTSDIDRIMEGPGTAPDEQDPADALPEIDERGPPVSRLHDIWLIGSHRVICGDAAIPETYRLLLRGERADMVFTDPPYNVRINGHARGRGQHAEFLMASGEMSPHEFCAFLERCFRLMATNSRDGAIHFACMDWRHLWEILAAAAPVYGAPKQLCVWVKDNAGMGSFYRSQHELVFVFKAGETPHINNFGLGERGRYRTNVWRYRGANSLGPNRSAALGMHPTVKPVALVVDVIKDCSRRNGVVLDPFSGSGTTVIAAERTGRRARVVELDPLYVDVIIRRWQAFAGKPAVHAKTNQTFEQMARARSAGGHDHEG